MKEYLIRIEMNNHSQFTTLSGDSIRPFQIAHNLYNYTTPWHAAQRLEKIAKAWEKGGCAVKRVFGSVADMPQKGNEFNIEKTLIDFNASSKTYSEIIRKYYHFNGR